MEPANDNHAVTYGSGNVFRDLDCEEAADALDEFRRRGGARYEDLRKELGLDADLAR